MPDVQLSLDGDAALRSGDIGGTIALCARALKTTLQLALAFSHDKQVLRISAHTEGQHLCLQFALDALSLSQTQAQGFFAIASLARSVSAAESLGLAPAVAHHILSALGGDLKLVKEIGSTGTLQVWLRRAVVAQTTWGQAA
jgi:K+-sensing histidine kinase KdpD